MATDIGELEFLEDGIISPGTRQARLLPEADLFALSHESEERAGMDRRVH